MNVAERQTAPDRAREGDVQALGDLLESYRPYLRAIARALRQRRLQARLDESDLVQDALLEVHRGFACFKGATVAEFVAWLRCVVIRAAGHALRSHLDTGKRAVAHERAADALDALADSGSTPSAQAMRHEQAARIAEALARLPDEMQEVLLARFVDDLPHAAI